MVRASRKERQQWDDYCRISGAGGRNASGDLGAPSALEASSAPGCPYLSDVSTVSRDPASCYHYHLVASDSVTAQLSLPFWRPHFCSGSPCSLSKWIDDSPWLYLGLPFVVVVVPYFCNFVVSWIHIFKIALYWSIVALKCCVSFCCAAKWMSYVYTYILFCGFPPHLGHSRALSRVPCAVQSVLISRSLPY